MKETERNMQEKRESRRRARRRGGGMGRGERDIREETQGKEKGGETYERQRKKKDRNRQKPRDREERCGEETER